MIRMATEANNVINNYKKKHFNYTSGSGSKEVPGGLGPASFLSQEKLFSPQGLSHILWATNSKIRIGHANWQGFNRETSLSYS